jgi:beta-1,4-mannosyltransferase
MQFHALSWQARGRPVHIVGLKGEPPAAGLAQVCTLLADIRPPGPWLLAAPLRSFANALNLLAHLCTIPTDVFLVQNPPSIPTLAVVLLASTWSGAAVVIDWHNLGFKMLEHGGRAPANLVRLARLYESLCARQADAHLCVTQALSEWLAREFRVQATTVYDRPHAEFARLQSQERNAVRAALPLGASWLREPDTALLVSATSWTSDEDFGMLFRGLKLYARANRGPRVVLVVTGKGPMKAYYETMIDQLNDSCAGRVCVRTAWLPAEDYPKLLGAADLGVSMHTSTSGLDLPMKIVDYFGAGLPVLAVDFACLRELVSAQNGRVFVDSESFAGQLEAALRGFPRSPVLAELGQGLGELEGWEKNWEQHALHVLADVRAGSRARRALLLSTLLSLLLCSLGVIGWASGAHT